MTTFQAVIYSLLNAFTEFLPLGSQAHHVLLSYALGWPAPDQALLTAMSLGACLALFFYFIHDWASILSSFVQVLLFRKKPMTLDERFPLFLAVSSLPAVFAWYYLKDWIVDANSQPRWAILGLLIFALPLWFFDHMSRKNKGMFDWSWMDCFYIGAMQVMMFVPGSGRLNGALCGSLSRNYHREAAAKYSLFAGMPILIGVTYMRLKDFSFHSPLAGNELSWFSWWVSLVLSTIAGMVAIGGLMKHVQRKGFSEYIAYRIVAGLSFVVLFWYRSKHR